MDYKKSLLKLILVNLAILAGFAIVILAVQFDLQKRAVNIIGIKEDLLNKKAALSDLSTLLAEEGKANDYSNQLGAYLISKDDLFLNFPKDVSSLAQQNGLNAQVSFKDETPPTATEPRKTNITLSLTGSIKTGNFMSFLVSLENSRYFVRLDSVDFNQLGDNMNANFSGEVYSFN